MTFKVLSAPPGWVKLAGFCVGRGTRSGTDWADQGKWILLQSTADNDPWVGAHDVNHRISTKLCEMIGADSRVVVPAPNVIHARFKLNDVLEPRFLTDHTIHSADDAAEREPSSLVSGGQLFESLKHAVRIEFTIGKIRFSVDLDFQLPGLLSSR